MNLTYKDIDYKKFLIRHYKHYKLNEEQLVVILCIDDILENMETLISAEDLLMYVSLSKDEVDKILVSLLELNYIAYVNNSSNKLITTLQPLYTKIVKDFKRDIYIENEEKKDKTTSSKINQLYPYFEELIGRPLNGKEVDRIGIWIRSGISENNIKEAVSKIKAKSNKISISAVDKVLHAISKSEDILVDGYSIQNDQEWVTDSAKTKEILSKKWIEQDD